MKTTSSRERTETRVSSTKSGSERSMFRHYLDRMHAGKWSEVFIFLGIAILTLAILTMLLKKSNPNHVTVGAALVMLLYVTVGAFLVLASCVFIAPEGTPRR